MQFFVKNLSWNGSWGHSRVFSVVYTDYFIQLFYNFYIDRDIDVRWLNRSSTIGFNGKKTEEHKAACRQSPECDSGCKSYSTVQYWPTGVLD